MGQKLKELDEYIENAINNIENDRAITSNLLTDLVVEIKSSQSHKELGQIAAKYVENLQRSNEQMVKLAALLQKQKSQQFGLSDNDKEQLFDLLNENQDEAP